MIHVRVDNDLKKQIELEAKKNHCSKIIIVNKALNQYLFDALTDEEYCLGKLEAEAKDLARLNMRFRLLANSFLSFVPLFIFPHPKIKDGYEKTREFKYDAVKMTNEWFKHMVEDLPRNDFEFYAHMQEVMVVNGS